MVTTYFLHFSKGTKELRQYLPQNLGQERVEITMKLAVDQIKNWIFVTGVVRSGTTFAGKVLSLPVEVDYIHEPYGEQRTISTRPDLFPYV